MILIRRGGHHGQWLQRTQYKLISNIVNKVIMFAYKCQIIINIHLPTTSIFTRWLQMNSMINVMYSAVHTSHTTQSPRQNKLEPSFRILDLIRGGGDETRPTNISPLVRIVLEQPVLQQKRQKKVKNRYQYSKRQTKNLEKRFFFVDCIGLGFRAIGLAGAFDNRTGWVF